MRIIPIYKSIPSYSPLGLVSTRRHAHHSTSTALPSELVAQERGPMAILPLRSVQLPTATEQFYHGWLADLQTQLTTPGADWYRIARDLLFEIH